MICLQIDYDLLLNYANIAYKFIIVATRRFNLQAIHRQSLGPSWAETCLFTFFVHSLPCKKSYYFYELPGNRQFRQKILEFVIAAKLTGKREIRSNSQAICDQFTGKSAAICLVQLGLKLDKTTKQRKMNILKKQKLRKSCVFFLSWFITICFAQSYPSCNVYMFYMQLFQVLSFLSFSP